MKSLASTGSTNRVVPGTRMNPSLVDQSGDPAYILRNMRNLVQRAGALVAIDDEEYLDVITVQPTSNVFRQVYGRQRIVHIISQQVAFWVDCAALFVSVDKELAHAQPGNAPETSRSIHSETSDGSMTTVSFLAGKKFPVFVLGAGVMAQAIATLLSSLQYHVIIYSAAPIHDLEGSNIINITETAQLPAALQRVEVFIIATNAGNFSAMAPRMAGLVRPSAMVINVCLALPRKRIMKMLDTACIVRTYIVHNDPSLTREVAQLPLTEDFDLISVNDSQELSTFETVNQAMLWPQLRAEDYEQTAAEHLAQRAADPRELVWLLETHYTLRGLEPHDAQALAIYALLGIEMAEYSELRRFALAQVDQLPDGESCDYHRIAACYGQIRTPSSKLFQEQLSRIATVAEFAEYVTYQYEETQFLQTLPNVVDVVSAIYDRESVKQRRSR